MFTLFVTLAASSPWAWTPDADHPEPQSVTRPDLMRPAGRMAAADTWTGERSFIVEVRVLRSWFDWAADLGSSDPGDATHTTRALGRIQQVPHGMGRVNAAMVFESPGGWRDGHLSPWGDCYTFLGKPETRALVFGRVVGDHGRVHFAIREGETGRAIGLCGAGIAIRGDELFQTACTFSQAESDPNCSSTYDDVSAYVLEHMNRPGGARLPNAIGVSFYQEYQARTIIDAAHTCPPDPE